MQSYSASQWHAAFAVEHFTDMEPRYYGYIHDFKRAIGGVFASGNFSTGKVKRALPDGGTRLDYHVVERDARLIVGHAHESRGEALGEARGLLTAMGGELLTRLIQERTQPKTAMPKLRKIGKRALAIFEASDGKCHYCGVELSLTGKWHIEHKMPRALFGGSEQSNLVAACVPCNMAKRDRTDLEFVAFLSARKAKFEGA
jgi:hypothetical protein